MKFNLESNKDYFARLESWHKVFTWLPKRVTDDNEYRWLEFVERKGLLVRPLSLLDPWLWEYRAIDHKNSSAIKNANNIELEKALQDAKL